MSFLIDNRLVVLVEHQSTINNNIPLRLLMYIARIYEKIVNRRKRYKNKLVKIPKPEFIVLYNGEKKLADYKKLKLSDAFKDVEGLKSPVGDTLPLELIVHVYNVNHGHNAEILKRSETLDGYSMFIGKIREYQKAIKTLEEAFRSAINYCIENNILKDYLEAHASEVLNMLLAEWNQDEYVEAMCEEAREEGLEEGREEGRKEGKLLIAKNLLAEGSTLEFVHRITGLSLEEIAHL